MRGLKRLKGIAFDIADLLRARSWAGLHDRQMQIWLDHATEDEEYEEVITFHTRTNPLTGSILWRTPKAVFFQPLPGKKRRYASVAAALDDLLPKQRVVVTDIAATAKLGAMAKQSTPAPFTTA
jgi:hypothetical protein